MTKRVIFELDWSGLLMYLGQLVVFWIGFNEVIGVVIEEIDREKDGFMIYLRYWPLGLLIQLIVKLVLGIRQEFVFQKRRLETGMNLGQKGGMSLEESGKILENVVKNKERDDQSVANGSVLKGVTPVSSSYSKKRDGFTFNTIERPLE